MPFGPSVLIRMLYCTFLHSWIRPFLVDQRCSMAKCGCQKGTPRVVRGDSSRRANTFDLELYLVEVTVWDPLGHEGMACRIYRPL